jgi:aspartate racemase
LEFIHIADPTGAYCTQNNLRRVGLLGTAFTMQQPFYRERLQWQYQLDVLVPTPAEQAFVHKVIYEELCLGAILESSKQRYLNIIDNLRKLGAEAVILGCTEIGLLVRQSDVDVPLVDTTAMHAEAAVCRALTEIQGRG